MKTRFLQWLAILLILECGWLHLASAQHEYEAAAVLGYLFVANFLGALLAAYGIYRSRAWGWALGAALSIGSLVGYAWSRTLGLPGLEVEAWFNPYGLVSLAAEGTFLALMLARPWRAAGAVEALPDAARVLRYALPASTLALLVVVSLATWEWAARGSEGHADGVQYGISEEFVTALPTTSMAELEQKYGVRVSLVAITALGSIVDVRLKIVDPDKAHDLLDGQAALLTQEKSLVLAPHMHSHGRLKPGGTFVVFFPTQRNTIRSGSQVSLVFGGVRIEAIAAR